MKPHRRLAVLLAAAVILVMDKFPPWAEWVSFAILIVLFLWPLWIWCVNKWWTKPRTFDMHVRTPDTHRLVKMWRVSPGQSRCELIVHLRHPTVIRRFNLRFVERKDGGNLPD